MIQSSRFTLKKSIETVELFLELVKQTLASGTEVLISGTGKYCVNKEKKVARQESGYRRGYDNEKPEGGDC